ncbi:MAG: hypothetical protein ABIQ42_11935, partial [Rhodoferax sp.]|uniref:hypothetical protein n=1 Tax=Rhodoferax sp. TaxID=50421 RepID=UPI003266AF23
MKSAASSRRFFFLWLWHTPSLQCFASFANPPRIGLKNRYDTQGATAAAWRSQFRAVLEGMSITLGLCFFGH